MKRKLLSLILVLFLFTGTFFVSACSKGGGYNLKNLSNDFYSIANEEGDNIVKNGNKIVFYYSGYVQDGEHYVANAINNSSIYSNIKDYNYVYENMLKFSFEYVEICSNNNIEIDKDVKNSIEDKMNNLHASINDVNINIDLFAGILKTTPVEERDTDIRCLNKFLSLLESYDKLYQNATIFNNELANLYYNHILTDSNPNIEQINAASFNANIVINRLDSRKNLQISNLSSAFAERYISNAELPEAIVLGQDFSLNQADFNYQQMISAIDVEINEDAASLVANAETNKLEFYQKSKKAYHAQEWFAVNNSKFVNACSKIKYTQIDVLNCTADELMSVNIVNDYTNSLLVYNNLLVEMLDIIEV